MNQNCRFSSKAVFIFVYFYGPMLAISDL